MVPAMRSPSATDGENRVGARAAVPSNVGGWRVVRAAHDEVRRPAVQRFDVDDECLPAGVPPDAPSTLASLEDEPRSDRRKRRTRQDRGGSSPPSAACARRWENPSRRLPAEAPGSVKRPTRQAPVSGRRLVAFPAATISRSSLCLRTQSSWRPIRCRGRTGLRRVLQDEHDGAPRNRAGSREHHRYSRAH